MGKIRVRKQLRKAHRYLGLFIGIQFILWTVSGLYFSWTDLDEIHGDHFKKSVAPIAFENLISPSALDSTLTISSVALREIDATPYYWVNNSHLYNAQTGIKKEEISEEEALNIASKHMVDHLEVAAVTRITSAGKHHEYRERLLPAYVVSYKGDAAIKAYISTKDGAFQTVRHRDWRWFDFLWMTHTMDYEGRDDINNWFCAPFQYWDC